MVTQRHLDEHNMKVKVLISFGLPNATILSLTPHVNVYSCSHGYESTKLSVLLA